MWTEFIWYRMGSRDELFEHSSKTVGSICELFFECLGNSWLLKKEHAVWS